jgi:hypothetical protein
MSLLLPHARGRSLAVLTAALLAAPLLGASPAAAAAPANDARASATDIGALPVTINGTTVEATVEPDEPASQCNSTKNSVWYRFTPTASRSVLFALDAAGDMDATVDVYTRVRSQLSGAGCATTDRRGEATLDVDVTAGSEYLVRVAALANSVADRFTLRVVAPDEPAKAPGTRLPSTGTAATVDRFANPDDAWYVDLVRGRTYRLNFVTKGDGCALVELFPAGTKRFGSASPIRHRTCDAHTVFVASATGRYPILVSAPRASREALPYRLRVGLALADDTAPGLSLAVDSTVRGRLTGSELDALDLYRFGVARRSDMRLHLGTERHFQLTLLTAGGRTLGSARHTIESRLSRGRYYVAVTALDGADGAYTLRRHARAITTARTLVDGRHTAYVPPGRNVSLSLQVSPAVSGPSTMLVERFDPIEGWLFAARFHPTVVAGRATVSYHPSGLGRWRVTAEFDGTKAASASEGGTATWFVVEPLTLSALARR